MRALVFATTLVAVPAAAQDLPVIATVSYPLAWMAERLAGDEATVVFPVPEGEDPAFWRPSIADITIYQSADLVALNGADFAQWTERASLPRSRLVDTSAPFADALIETESVTHSHGNGEEHSHTGVASFTWLDFQQAADQAGALAAGMSQLDGLAQTVALNLSAVEDDLTRLHVQATQVGARLDGKIAIASHPRYQYFSRAYGVEISAVEWEAGAAPTEAELAALAALVLETGATLFIWEAEPPAEARESVAALGLSDAVLPPLANRPAEGDFLTNMSEALNALDRAAGMVN
ncbi:MAG: metal ABC transporter substrate-binding protein [Pseudomonadota bacterium]